MSNAISEALMSGVADAMDIVHSALTMLLQSLSIPAHEKAPVVAAVQTLTDTTADLRAAVVASTEAPNVATVTVSDIQSVVDQAVAAAMVKLAPPVVASPSIQAAQAASESGILS